jgi:hypothetical protein
MKVLVVGCGAGTQTAKEIINQLKEKEGWEF